MLLMRDELLPELCKSSIWDTLPGPSGQFLFESARKDTHMVFVGSEKVY